MEQNENNKILLHACCAICSAHPIELLKSLGYEVVVYFYNPNIFPSQEYSKRLEAQKILCNHFNIPLIEGNYAPQAYYDYVKGYEKCPEKGERCKLCFKLRLKETARKAKELGIKEFTTSIVISPHKNFSILTDIGEKIAQKENLTYTAIDFKKKDGFLKTNKISKDLELYRQNYCGCEFSKPLD